MTCQGDMDTGDKEKLELERRNDDHDPVTYQSPSQLSDWRDGIANLTHTSTGGSLIGSATMVNSFGSVPSQQLSSSQNLGHPVSDIQSNMTSYNSFGTQKACSASFGGGVDRNLDMSWISSSSLMKGNVFLPNLPGPVPQSFTQLPADSGFIERAARFSCFGSGNLSDMGNPMGIAESMGLFPRDVGMMQGQQEAFSGNGVRTISGDHSHKNEINPGEASKGGSLPVEHGATKGSPLKNVREDGARSYDESKLCPGRSANESDEGDSSCNAGQDDLSALKGGGGESTPMGAGSRKRKRTGQDTETDQGKEAGKQSDEVAKDFTENQQKRSPATNKISAKQDKPEPQASDPPNEQYIHVRARRGQATNSHSLAERVRREKISQRMKFLQDLVPGCSKVTGKAVMLDEIINYVQSLQRQVEFLSMKLATVNPRLDFDVEGLLAKDIFQHRAGPSYSYSPGFPPEMPTHFPPGPPSQLGQIQAGLHTMGTSSDILHRAINPQYTPMTGGFKEATQLSHMWEDGLHNVIQTGIGAADPPSGEELNGSAPSGHMKGEM